jgi:hypothetical protein
MSDECERQEGRLEQDEHPGPAETQAESDRSGDPQAWIAADHFEWSCRPEQAQCHQRPCPCRWLPSPDRPCGYQDWDQHEPLSREDQEGSEEQSCRGRVQHIATDDLVGPVELTIEEPLVPRQQSRRGVQVDG